MLTMLIKLLPYTKVLKLMTKMLRSSKGEGDDRWRKLSRVLTEALIPLLAAQKIHIEDKNQLDMLHHVFAALGVVSNNILVVTILGHKQFVFKQNIITKFDISIFNIEY